MGPIAADAAQVVPAEVKPVAGEQRLGSLLVERRPLELEEEELGLDLGGSLLHELQERSPGRVGGVGGKAQRGVGPRPARPAR